METDTSKIAYALGMWRNFIQTGDMSMSAEDAKRSGERVNALDIEQMKFVIRLDELAQKALQGKIKILD